MIKGVGCDITDIYRIEKAMKNPGFSQRVYTKKERNYIKKSGADTAAGLWAAKEAVSKALGTGFAGFGLSDIEICHNENGRPYVLFHAGASKIYNDIGANAIYISISHEKNTAMAFAVIEG